MEAKGAGEMHLSASGAEAASRTRARCNHHPLSVEAFCHRFDVAKRAPSGLPNFVPVVCAPNERAAGHSLASIAASHTQPPLAAPQRRRCRLSASPPPSLPCVASSNISTTFTTSFIAASVAAPQQPPPPPDPPPPCPFQYHHLDRLLRTSASAFSSPPSSLPPHSPLPSSPPAPLPPPLHHRPSPPPPVSPPSIAAVGLQHAWMVHQDGQRLSMLHVRERCPRVVRERLAC